MTVDGCANLKPPTYCIASYFTNLFRNRPELMYINYSMCNVNMHTKSVTYFIACIKFSDSTFSVILFDRPRRTPRIVHMGTLTSSAGLPWQWPPSLPRCTRSLAASSAGRDMPIRVIRYIRAQL